MLIFNFTYNIESKIHSKWLEWMKMNIIPKALETQLPKDIKVFKLLTEIPNDGETYTLQFVFDNQEDYQKFDQQHKDIIFDRHDMLFRGKYVLFNSLLEKV